METQVEVRKPVNGVPQVAPQWANEQQQIVQSSILAPRLHLMQKMSKLVEDGKAQVGDIAKLPSGAIAAKKGEILTVVPIALNETWLLEEEVDKKFVYRSREKRTTENDGLPWTFQQGGTNWRRTKVQEYFVLVLSEIQREVTALKDAAKGGIIDPDAALLPSMISFQKFSLNAGKEISTFFAKANLFKSPLFYSTFKIAAKSIVHKNQTFWVYTVEKGDKTPQEFYDTCTRWQNLILKGAVKAEEMVQEDDATGPEEAASTENDKY